MYIFIHDIIFSFSCLCYAGRSNPSKSLWMLGVQRMETTHSQTLSIGLQYWIILASKLIQKIKWFLDLIEKVLKSIMWKVINPRHISLIEHKHYVKYCQTLVNVIDSCTSVWRLYRLVPWPIDSRAVYRAPCNVLSRSHARYGEYPHPISFTVHLIGRWAILKSGWARLKPF